MSQALVVVRAFAGHKPGEVITDPLQMARILGSELKSSVVPVAQPQWQPPVTTTKGG